jgi:hypothetical protein
MKKLSIYLYLIIFLLIASIKSSFAIDSDIKDMLDNLDGVQKSIKDLDESKLQEAVKIDAAVEEINKVTQFVKESLENNDNESAIKALEFIEKSLTDVGSLIPQEFSSDMSKADLGSLGEDNMKIISEITADMKTKKEEKLSDLITNMIDLNEKGLASFEISESLKEIGVDTIQLEVALKTRAVDLGKKLQENNLVVIDKRSSLVELETKLDSIPLQMDQLYNQKNDLLNQVEEKAKQDWVGYEEEHAQFDNQILDIHKKLADFEKEKNEITQSITTLNSELNELELEVIPEINTQISKLNKAGVAMTMDQLYNQKNDLLDQVEEMAKDDWVGYEEERTQFNSQMLVIETKLDGLESGKNEITQSATTLNFDRSDIAKSSIKDLVENPEVIKQISELSIEFNNANNVVDIMGDVARAMEGLSVEADVALSMVDLKQQKNALFDQVEEMAKQDWVGFEEEHAQFDNQILDINKKLADIEKSGQ